uniref:Uncharacterized protein n=1 Tax=Anguilla anguilla TaxID=7936 RepID=A0A0E9XJM4_ANGAN
MSGAKRGSDCQCDCAHNLEFTPRPQGTVDVSIHKVSLT